MSHSYPDSHHDRAHEMKLSVGADSCPFAALSAELDYRLDLLESITPHGESDQLTAFVRLHGTDAETLHAALDDSETLDGLQVLKAYDHELICEITVVGTCVIRSLAQARTLFHSGTAEGGQGRFVAILPPDGDPDAVIEALEDTHRSLSVLAIRERPVAAPLLTRHGFQTLLEDRLTDRQWTALRLAHEGGYFKRPAEIDQGSLARDMGISQETVSQHLRAG